MLWHLATEPVWLPVKPVELCIRPSQALPLLPCSHSNMLLRVLAAFLSLCLNLLQAKRGLTGIMNYTNPGAISHNEVRKSLQLAGAVVWVPWPLLCADPCGIILRARLQSFTCAPTS